MLKSGKSVTRERTTMSCSILRCQQLQICANMCNVRHSCQHNSSLENAVSLTQAGSGMQGDYSQAPTQTMLHQHQACRHLLMVRMRRYSCWISPGASKRWTQISSGSSRSLSAPAQAKALAQALRVGKLGRRLPRKQALRSKTAAQLTSRSCCGRAPSPALCRYGHAQHASLGSAADLG